MELFPPQPDLSLQISPPNTTPHHQEDNNNNIDLGFWKRALESRKPHNINTNNTSCFDLSLSSNIPKPTNTHQEPNYTSSQYFQNNTNFINSPFIPHHHYHHHHHDLGLFRPINGVVPLSNNNHQNPSTTFPIQASPSSFNSYNSNPISSSNSHFHQSHNHHQNGPVRSRFFSRFPTKRSMRAPRMRWTSTLHARFVHAVDLLGGHESRLFVKYFYSHQVFTSSQVILSLV